MYMVDTTGKVFRRVFTSTAACLPGLERSRNIDYILWIAVQIETYNFAHKLTFKHQMQQQPLTVASPQATL